MLECPDQNFPAASSKAMKTQVKAFLLFGILLSGGLAKLHVPCRCGSHPTPQPCRYFRKGPQVACHPFALYVPYGWQPPNLHAQILQCLEPGWLWGATPQPPCPKFAWPVHCEEALKSPLHHRAVRFVWLGVQKSGLANDMGASARNFVEDFSCTNMGPGSALDLGWHLGDSMNGRASLPIFANTYTCSLQEGFRVRQRQVPSRLSLLSHVLMFWCFEGRRWIWDETDRREGPAVQKAGPHQPCGRCLQQSEQGGRLHNRSQGQRKRRPDSGGCPGRRKR